MMQYLTFAILVFLVLTRIISITLFIFGLALWFIIDFNKGRIKTENIPISLIMLVLLFAREKFIASISNIIIKILPNTQYPFEIGLGAIALLLIIIKKASKK